MTQKQFEVALSNYTALRVDLLQSAQSSPNALSRKGIIVQTLRLSHKLNLKLIRVLDGGIVE